MQHSPNPAIIASLLLMLACASIRPGPQPATTSGPETIPPVTPTASPIPLGGDSTSPIRLHVGYGLRGAWFEAYFTDPANPVSSQWTGGLDGPLVEAIDAARLSVHAAIYNITLNNVREALLRAHRRGVDVRLVTESDNLEGIDLQRLIEGGVPVLGDRREGTMHDKFMVIDASQVWTGSMNYTSSGTYLDNNTIIQIESPELAADYESEFLEMFEDDRFGPQAGRLTPHPVVQVNGTTLEVFFAPDDGAEAALVDLLDTARHSIRFLAYSFTSDPLGEAIVRADRAGLVVEGVMDTDQAESNSGTELPGFRLDGIDVRLDGNPGQMHEKVFIVDEEIVVVGSYNFSRNANEVNDENVLIIHNPAIAAAYTEEFMRIYAAAQP